MLGLSGLGLVALVTSGNEYGCAIRKNRQQILSLIDERVALRKVKKAKSFIDDAYNTIAKFYELLDDVDKAIKEKPELLNNVNFAKSYLILKDCHQDAEEYYRIVTLLICAESLPCIIDVDKVDKKRFKVFKMNVMLMVKCFSHFIVTNDKTEEENEEV